uniref:Vitellogenin domain-containing protein n=1 Tax=Ditylenchus dipsaci TaxID=166011 RepID=A0A915EE65_9BILA
MGFSSFLLALLLPFVALSYGLPPSATSFEAGRSYTYSYDSQTATGMILQPDAHHSFGLSNPSNSSSQRSLLRIKAVVNLQFKSSDKHQAILQLSGVRIGAARREVDSPASRLQPWSSFEPKDNHADQEKRDQLQLPVGFRYEKGLVSTIVFDGRDMPWSKNFKKAILTLLQINLEKEHDEDEDIKQGKYASDRQHQSTFTLPETTVEGKCPVTYSIDHTHGGMNVSKHVHLRHCSLTSDISFGFDSIKDDVLQRSTTIRYKLAGQDPTQYGIQRVKAYSHYLFTSPEWSYSSTEQPKDAIQPLLQTNVVSELHFRGSQPSSTNFNQPPGGEEESETLLLNTAESIKEKRLFMYGDADQQLGKRGRQWRGGNTNETPHYAHPAFFKEKERVDQARIVINKILSQSAFEQTKGISTQAVVYIGQLVELLRKCSVKEIEAIYVKYSGDETTAESLTNTPAYGRQNEKARQIVDDCLAAAGTRNALAAFVLKAVMGSIHSSPSDDQAKIMVELCQSSVVNGDSIAKQSCWLTTGALIEEVCRPRPEAMRKQLGNGNDKMCSSAKKEFYVQTLVQNYKSATTTSDKIVALKVIGNAGLDMIPEIDQILQSVPDQDKQLATILQVHALDALRRLRKHMPKKVARFVLPIVLDKKEKSSVRISAFWQLMGCQPVEKSTIDQLIYMLKEEDHSAQLYSFIYTTFETMAASREFSQMHIAKYLTKVMQELPPMYERSRILSMRLNSKQNPMGNPLAINFANIGSHTSLLPLFTSIGLGSPAQSLQKTLPHMVTLCRTASSSATFKRAWSSAKSQTENQQEKCSAWIRSSVHLLYSHGRHRPVLLVADETYLAKLLKQMPENDGLQTSKNIKCNLVLSVGEKWAQIPTSSGLVLKFGHSLPAMASVNGRVQVKSASAASLRLKFQVQPTVRVAHIHTMEVVSPIVAAGVENMQSVETNYPIDLEVESVALTEENESGLRFTFNTPRLQPKK